MRATIFTAVFLGLFAGAATPVCGPAAAQPRYYARDGIQPLDRLLPGIRRAHPGNFYDAEGPTYGPSGDPHYHLKWMTPDGRVIWYDADARNGRVLRASPGRDSFDAPPPARPYGPYTADPYDRGYGRQRQMQQNFNGPPVYARPYGGRGDGGERRGRR